MTPTTRFALLAPPGVPFAFFLVSKALQLRSYKGGDVAEPWVYALALIWALAAVVELVVLPIAVYQLCRAKQERTFVDMLCLLPAVGAIALVIGTLVNNIFFGT